MTAQEQPTNQFKVEVDGSPLGDDVAATMLSAVVETSINLPDAFMLTFRDQHRDVLERGNLKVGAVVIIRVFSAEHTGGAKVVEGEITAVEMEVETQGTFTIVRGFDRTHRLHRRRTTTAHRDMSYSDVARKLAGDAGLNIGTIDSTRQIRKHIAQINSTDWALLKSLAGEVGYDVGIVDGKFNFRKPPKASNGPAGGTTSSTDPLQLSVGVNLIRCRATISAADQVKTVEVRGWNPETKESLVGEKSAGTVSVQNGSSADQLADLFASERRVSVDVPYSNQSEVDAAAASLAECVASTFAELEGVTRGDPRLRAGASVSLGLAKPPFDGKYVLTTARHTWVPDEGYLVTFEASGSRDRSIHGLISGSGDDAPSRRGLMGGVTIGVVTDVQDPDNRFRVKLRFPWLDDNYESDWARTAHSGAGAKRGWLVLPEVGDEVLVAFQHGDLGRPFVIGGLYNGVDEPGSPATEQLFDGTAGKVNRRTFVSRLGHRLVFVDDSNGPAVGFGSEGEMAVSAEKAITVTSSKNGIKVEAKQDVTITSTSGDVKISGKNVEIEGTKVSVSGSAGVTIDGGPDASIKGSVVNIN